MQELNEAIKALQHLTVAADRAEKYILVTTDEEREAFHKLNAAIGESKAALSALRMKGITQ
jgi:hypothetical protein